jgi:hypothetical protein
MADDNPRLCSRRRFAQTRRLSRLMDLTRPREESPEVVAYNPNFPAEFSRNKVPSRIYRLTICTLRCPVWAMIDRSEAPAMAALVA